MPDYPPGLNRIERANLLWLAEKEGRDPSSYAVRRFLGQAFATDSNGDEITL